MCNRRNLRSEFQMRSTLKRVHSERKLMAVMQHCHCLIHQPFTSSLPLTVGFHYGTLLVSFLSCTPFVSVLLLVLLPSIVQGVVGFVHSVP